jgi:hypothetical protein
MSKWRAVRDRIVGWSIASIAPAMGDAVAAH